MRHATMKFAVPLFLALLGASAAMLVAPATAATGVGGGDQGVPGRLVEPVAPDPRRWPESGKVRPDGGAKPPTIEQSADAGSPLSAPGAAGGADAGAPDLDGSVAPSPDGGVAATPDG